MQFRVIYSVFCKVYLKVAFNAVLALLIRELLVYSRVYVYEQFNLFTRSPSLSGQYIPIPQSREIFSPGLWSGLFNFSIPVITFSPRHLIKYRNVGTNLYVRPYKGKDIGLPLRIR